MFDKILGNLDLGSMLGNLGNVEELAERFGIPADQIQNVIGSLSGKLGENGDQLSALLEAAKEHGVSMDSIKGLMDNLGGEGGNPLDKLTDLFGKK